MRRSLLIAILVFALCPAAALRGQPPTGWRGDGTGRFPGSNPVTTWSPKNNIVWKTPLPGGSPASPVLVGEKVFVLSDPALLLCLQASDGKLLWKRGHTAAEVGDGEGAKAGNDLVKHSDFEAGSAAGTPVSDGKHVYAMFANGIVSAHDLDGKQKWVRFIEKPKINYGHATSPALVGGKLVVQFLDVVALDADTGKEAWRVKLPASHASPVGTRVGDVDVVVHPSGSILRTTDGKVLAEKLFQLGPASPVVHEGVIYAHEKGKLKAFALPTQAGEALAVKPLWESETPLGQYQIPSPVVHEGLVYGVTMTAIWQVTDAKTGKEVYRERLPFTSRVYVSVHLAGGKLFVADQQGKTLVLQPGRTHNQVALNELENNPTSFAFAGKRLYIRTEKHLYCIGE